MRPCVVWNMATSAMRWWWPAGRNSGPLPEPSSLGPTFCLFWIFCVVVRSHGESHKLTSVAYSASYSCPFITGWICVCLKPPVGGSLRGNVTHLIPSTGQAWNRLLWTWPKQMPREIRRLAQAWRPFWAPMAVPPPLFILWGFITYFIATWHSLETL